MMIPFEAIFLPVTLDLQLHMLSIGLKSWLDERVCKITSDNLAFENSVADFTPHFLSKG